MHDPVSFTLAVLALLVTPGPTNTLLAASGAIAGLARSMRLIPAELCGYLAAIATLLFIADPAIENHAQESAQRCAQGSRKRFVELIDRAQLLASDLPRLPYVPWLDKWPGGWGGSAPSLAGKRGSSHGIDFALIENFLHTLTLTFARILPRCTQPRRPWCVPVRGLRPKS